LVLELMSYQAASSARLTPPSPPRDPTRRAILARPASRLLGMELAEPFAMSQPGICHIKVLERAGLIRAGATRSRPCRIEAQPLAEASEWIERYREFGKATSSSPTRCWKSSSPYKNNLDGRGSKERST
jgi:hypothetical protein